MTPDEHKLQNPAWFSLAESHQEYAVTFPNAKFYYPDNCPFGGFVSTENVSEAIKAYSKLAQDFYIVGEKPIYDDSIKLIKELVCLQMQLDTQADIAITEEIVPLNQQYEEELFNLVNLGLPGYFRRKTSELGSYFGILKNDKLVAITGERMKMNAYTEISAVVTHPEHTRKGYAQQLISYTANKTFSENKTPYLHVAETNFKAISLYEQLGFRAIRKMSFWHLRSRS